METRDLISPNVRREAREYMVGWTLARIGDVFRDHGFHADLDYLPPVSGERRSYVEQFYATVNWCDRKRCERMLSVYEALLDDAEEREGHDSYAAQAMWSEKFARMLARDGFERDALGRLRPRWASVESRSMADLPAESAIPLLLRRMWDSVDEAPDACIGAAKEAIETTAKHLLLMAGEKVSPTEKMSSLIARAQKLLDLHPADVAPSKSGADTIKSVLGALSQAALGVNALRRDYGAGHGRAVRPSGLSPRHAQLAAQAGDAWVRFMLDTQVARSSRAAAS